MKKLLPILILGIVALISFSSCGKDEDNEKYDACIIGGITYPLASSYACYWDEEEGYMGFDLFIEAANEQFRVNLFFLYCQTDEPVLKNGTYPNESKGLYFDGACYYTTDGWESETYVSGDAKLTVKGFGNDVYEFTWTATDENGSKVSGYYKGVVEMVQPEW